MSLPPGWLLWQTSPTYVTSTCFPFSFLMTNLTLTLHSGRLHSAPPLKNTAEWILREFSDLTWLFLKRKLHHGLLSLTLLRKIRVQSPLSNRPPLGNVLIGILFQSSFVNLNLAVVPSMLFLKYFSGFPSSSPASDESESSCKKRIFEWYQLLRHSRTGKLIVTALKKQKGVFARHFRGICVGTITVGPTAHLRWIADALKLARNANRIGAILNYAICKYRIVGIASADDVHIFSSPTTTGLPAKLNSAQFRRKPAVKA